MQFLLVQSWENTRFLKEPHNERKDAQPTQHQDEAGVTLFPPTILDLVMGGEVGGRLSGPGVCVILAVCQSGVGNGHRVITAALTASSISLYRCLSLSPLPPSHSIFLTPETEERKTDWVTERHTRNGEWNKATAKWWCLRGRFYTCRCYVDLKKVAILKFILRPGWTN